MSLILVYARKNPPLPTHVYPPETLKHPLLLVLGGGETGLVLVLTTNQRNPPYNCDIGGEGDNEYKGEIFDTEF